MKLLSSAVSLVLVRTQEIVEEQEGLLHVCKSMRNENQRNYENIVPFVDPGSTLAVRSGEMLLDSPDYGARSGPVRGAGPGSEQRYTFSSQDELVNTMLQYMLNAYNLDKYVPSEILNYGCWCQTSAEHLRHRRGTPVDTVDRKCQNWTRCQKCIQMDTFGQCNPTEQVYQVWFDPSTRQFACSSSNSDCQMKACHCDSAFVNSKRVDIFYKIHKLDYDNP